MIIFVVGKEYRAVKANSRNTCANQLLLFACRSIQLLPFHSHLLTLHIISPRFMKKSKCTNSNSGFIDEHFEAIIISSAFPGALN